MQIEFVFWVNNTFKNSGDMMTFTWVFLNRFVMETEELEQK